MSKGGEKAHGYWKQKGTVRQDDSLFFLIDRHHSSFSARPWLLDEPLRIAKVHDPLVAHRLRRGEHTQVGDRGLRAPRTSAQPATNVKRITTNRHMRASEN